MCVGKVTELNVSHICLWNVPRGAFEGMLASRFISASWKVRVDSRITHRLTGMQVVIRDSLGNNSCCE